MISFTTSQSKEDLQGILSLQQANLEANITSEELASQGFVTVEHNYDLLSAMNDPYPHIIAKDAGMVVGYALVMLPAFGNSIPVLVPMFEQINTLVYENNKLAASKYFVMGQVCVGKGCRGKGVFAGLYEKMKVEMKNDFDYIITEISARNKRSLRAHEKVGFKTLKTYWSEEGEEWVVVILRIRM